MTLGNRTLRVEYSGNGATTNFSFADRWFGLKVLLADKTSLDVTEQTEGVDYTLSAPSGSDGVTITFTAAPTSDENIIIISETPRTQDANYLPNSAFSAESHETALDKIVAVIQETDDIVNRNLQLAQGFVDSFDTGFVPKASSLLQVNATGDKIESVPIIQNVFTGNMLGFKITNMADGISDQDATTKKQVDDAVAAISANALDIAALATEYAIPGKTFLGEQVYCMYTAYSGLSAGFTQIDSNVSSATIRTLQLTVAVGPSTGYAYAFGDTTTAAYYYALAYNNETFGAEKYQISFNSGFSGGEGLIYHEYTKA